jgi:hypothetical protein
MSNSIKPSKIPSMYFIRSFFLFFLFVSSVSAQTLTPTCLGLWDFTGSSDSAVTSAACATSTASMTATQNLPSPTGAYTTSSSKCGVAAPAHLLQGLVYASGPAGASPANAGMTFCLPSSGYQLTSFNFYTYSSGSGPKTFSLAYSTASPSAFITITVTGTATGTATSTSISIPLSSVSALTSLSKVCFQLSVTSPVPTSMGTSSYFTFDDVMVSGVQYGTASPTPSGTSTPSPTASNTPTISQTPSNSPTSSWTPTGTGTPSQTPSQTMTPSQTPSQTATPSVTFNPPWAATSSNAAFIALRVGNGATTLSSSAVPVYLDSYSRTGTLLGTVALPYSPGIGNMLTLSGTSQYEGYLTTSTNGKYLVLAGYNVSSGTSSPTTLSNARTIATVDACDNVVINSGFTETSSGAVVESAVNDGSNFWVSTKASTSTIRYIPSGSFSGTTIYTKSSSNYLYDLQINSGSLFLSYYNGYIYNFGTSLPTTSTTPSPITSLTGYSTLQFSFCSASMFVAADTGLSALYSYTGSGSSWSQYALIASVTTYSVSCVPSTINAGYDIFYGTAVTSGNSIYVYNTITATSSLIATAATNTVFRGLAPALTDTYCMPTVTATATATPSQSSAPSVSTSLSSTSTSSSSPSASITASQSATSSVSASSTGTLGGSPDPTTTQTPSVTPSPSNTASVSSTSTQTPSSTAFPSSTSTNSQTMTPSQTSSGTFTPTQTSSPTSSVSFNPPFAATSSNAAFVALRVPTCATARCWAQLLFLTTPVATC